MTPNTIALRCRGVSRRRRRGAGGGGRLRVGAFAGELRQLMTKTSCAVHRCGRADDGFLRTSGSLSVSGARDRRRWNALSPALIATAASTASAGSALAR